MKPEEIMKALEGLSSEKEGSLVKEIKKLKFSNTRTVLFIGLGGLGCKAVNKIKGIYTSEFEHSDNVSFLAVDTAEDDLDKIKIGNPGGNLKTGETFELFDASAVDLLINQPPEIKGWIGGLEPRKIDEKGAQQVRQISRVMLCGTNKYSLLESNISKTIESLNKINSVNVVIISGLSGGTGSGTFIDISYMVRNILGNHKQPSDLWGVFFSPDTQKQVPEIKNNPSAWECLKRNGYAALKELDYYMTNGSYSVSEEPVYRINVPGKGEITSSEHIFDAGKAFIVTPNSAVTEVDEILNAAARSIMYMYQDIPANASSFQTILSTYSNIIGQMSTWRTKHAGKCVEAGATEDPSGIDNAEFPVFMNYCYGGFGYNSVYFPRDEIMAYAANAVMTGILDKWKKNDLLTQSTVDATARRYKIDSLASIAAAVKEEMHITRDALRIDEKNDAKYWPKVTKVFGVGKVSETNVTTSYAKKKADDIFKTKNNASSWTQITDKIVKPLTDALSTQDYMANKGPFVCIATLGGYSGIVGICDKLDNLKADTDKYKKASSEIAETKKEKMLEAAKLRESDITPTNEEMDEFIGICANYSEAVLDNLIYNNISGIIDLIRNKIRKFSNETFDIFIPIIEQLTEILNGDAMITATGRHSYAGNTHYFSMDAYGLEQSDEKRKRFQDLFRGYIDDAKITALAIKFADSMFGAESKDKWKNLQNQPDQLADEIRNVFSDFFKPFANSILEKFIVLAYSENRNMTPQQLNQIWGADDNTNDAQVRDSAITAAAQNIAAKLRDQGSILAVSNVSDTQFEALSTQSVAMLLQQTPRLNAEIKKALGNKWGYGDIGNDCKSIIYAVNFSNPIALPLIDNIHEFAQAYYNSESATDTSAGRHLDEHTQNWVKYLPELYGCDTEEYYVGKKSNTYRMKYPRENNDAEMYREIKEAVDYGIEHGYIYIENGKYYCLKIEGVSDGYKALYDNYTTGLKNDPAYSWISAADEADRVNNTLKCNTFEIECDNAPLMARITVNPADERKIKNIYRVVRSDMDLEKNIIGLEKTYKESGIFEHLDKIKANRNN